MIIITSRVYTNSDSAYDHATDLKQHFASDVKVFHNNGAYNVQATWNTSVYNVEEFLDIYVSKIGVKVE